MMGFFDKMFEKKECAICGTELGLLGKTKINEGYLCKECAGKLSPFFVIEHNIGAPGRKRTRGVERRQALGIGLAVGELLTALRPGLRL